MKTTHKLFCMLSLFSCTLVHAQDQDPAQQKAWMEYMTPSKQHQQLAMAKGNWTEEVTMWMSADAPAMKSNSTITNTMIMGGRYQQGIHKGSMMGQPFEGMSIVGYDNKLQVYQSTWIDNMGTGIMMMEGTWNEELKAIEFKGNMVDPVSGAKLAVREVYTVVNENEHTLEMFMSPAEGKEYKSMSIVMKRATGKSTTQKADGKTPVKSGPTDEEKKPKPVQQPLMPTKN
ncbi:MAG: DUF1579 domain-containing protein [Bacteroidota bacterium]